MKHKTMEDKNIEPILIATNAKTAEIVKKYDFIFKKSLGQNFLIDFHVLNKIVKAAEITKDDLLIEIGPGVGGLTQILAEKAGKVIAIEIDSVLIPILHETLENYDNVELINEDVLKIDFFGLISAQKYKNVKLVANLPYYITTPIVMGLLEKSVPLESITVMVQKEVAYRMCAVPGSKDYGALSLTVSFYAEPYLVANVPQNCFMPRPGIDSAVIKLTRRKQPPISVIDAEFMFKIIKAAFSMRRKTLVNCLFSADFLNLSKEQLARILEKCGLDEKVRGETLGLVEFAMIADILI